MRTGIALLLVLLAQPVPKLRGAVPQERVVDRIVARIEDDILTLSEVRELGSFQQLVNGCGAATSGDAPRDAELIERLIDQWIVHTEATASRFPRASAAGVQREIEHLEKQFATAEAYRARLRELGLTPEMVARHVERQLYLARYLDYKFRPAVQVEIVQVRKYYEEQLLPELKRRGEQAPALEKVEAQIHELLTQREITARTKLWLEETRARLRIEVAGKESGK